MINKNYSFRFISFAVLTAAILFISCHKSNNGPSAYSLPVFRKIVVVIGENTGVDSVLGNTVSAPYINSLAHSGAEFVSSYGVEHPSQPNYFDLISGSNQGITDNNLPPSHFTTPNLARELIDIGKTFTLFAEDLPSIGFDGEYSGLYARRHNPVANWMGTGTNQVPASTNQPFTTFPSDFSMLPDVSFVIPNVCSDGHDVCPPYNNRVKQFDAWVQTNLDAYRQWCINNNSLLIITYDEDDHLESNKIATVFYGSNVHPGLYRNTINHFNILRTVEDRTGLKTHAGAAATAGTIDYCWK